jgi:hypothetical protein
MSQAAGVHSIEALRALHAALVRFGPEAQEALGAAVLEIRRVEDHLHDQLKHWQRQVEKRHEDLNRARADLAHQASLHRGEKHGVTELELAVRKARERLRQAEEKVVTVRRWLLALPKAISDYQGPARRLAGMLDADLKHGLVILENKIAALEAYAALEKG